jgi:hypothetical protein
MQVQPLPGSGWNCSIAEADSGSAQGCAFSSSMLAFTMTRHVWSTRDPIAGVTHRVEDGTLGYRVVRIIVGTSTMTENACWSVKRFFSSALPLVMRWSGGATTLMIFRDTEPSVTSRKRTP